MKYKKDEMTLWNNFGRHQVNFILGRDKLFIENKLYLFNNLVEPFDFLNN